MGAAGGAPDWYGYCLDDPVNMIDPLGLEGFGVSGYGYYGAEWGGNPTGGKGDSSGDAESKNSGEQTGDSDNNRYSGCV